MDGKGVYQDLAHRLVPSKLPPEHRMKAFLLCDDCHVDAVVSLCQSHGMGIEIQSFFDPELPKENPQSILDHRHAISSIPLRSLHGPFADLCPGSFDIMVRNVARHRFDYACDVARELGASHVVFHHGYVPGTSPGHNWLSRSRVFWKDFLSSAPPGIHFHLENMLEHDPELIVDLVDALSSPVLDVCLDIGHAHCHGRVPVVNWIERLGQRIGYVHLHDNDGESDEHLGLGTIPIREVCQVLGSYAPNAIWALETRAPGLEQSIKCLEDNAFLGSATKPNSFGHG
jgi:sugar phosphate isomerase/epimerase